MWPKLRGQAGPAPNAGDHEPEPESDTHLELLSVPADSNVKHPRLSLSNLSLTVRSFRILFMICYNMSLE
jgi:hypothetical protein